MRQSCVFLLHLLLLAAFPCLALAQNWGRVEGRVTNATTGSALPGATVLVADTDFGTATSADGHYTLRLPEGRHILRFSTVGFVAHFDTVRVRRDEMTRLDVALEEQVVEMGEVTVEETRTPTETGAYELDPEDVEKIPAPFRGFQALKSLPGVASNNELSNQYSVRGGGYNENLIFINGFEVYMPFRPRQGEQEGLGLLNPALAERITLYAGGFPARYGGKLSSALEIEYRRPEEQPLEGAAAASLLDLDVHAGASALDGRLGWIFGVRKARPSRFFGTQELKGDYDPDYTDVQGGLYFDLTPRHELEVLGLWADHEFQLAPTSKRTYFGAVSPNPRIPSNFQSLYTDYGGRRTDGYATHFLGGRLSSSLSQNFHAEHDVSYFGTEEREAFGISGRTALSQVNPASGEEFLIGTGRMTEAADNRVGVSTLTGRGRYRLTLSRHALEAGWHARRLRFDDRLDERATFTARNGTGELETTLIEGLSDRATFEAAQAGLYVQNTFDALSESDRLLVTAGVRGDYFSFNEEWTLSPRLSARYRLSDNTRLTGALGVYHQKPTYREFRGKPEPGDTTLAGRVNRDLTSQRSVQVVAGGEHFFPKKRFYLRAEAYYKHLTDLISYDIENVRVLYSGHNDTRGFTYGLDVQLRGELVPGLESWFNYSYLVSRERFLPAFQTAQNEGLVPRPADQQHTFSAFIQDYVPGDETWKLHLRALYGSGLPYTPPEPGPEVASSIKLHRPGPRNAFRLPEYRRVDVGVTKLLTVFEEGINRPVELKLTAEILNLFDMVNTVAYAWDGHFNRTPTHLTPRTINARLEVIF